MKRILLSIIFVVIAIFAADAQQILRVHLADNTVKTWKAWQVDSIDFIAEEPLSAPVSDTKIDLGLSVLWSPVNLGATSPDEVGHYYGWGEISGLNMSKNLKYYPFSGVKQDIKASNYDMATAAWREQWRLPSKEEIQELIDNCTWELAEGGYSLTSKVNGNSIFLPFVKYRDGEVVNDEFNGLMYWTGNIGTDTDKAICLKLSAPDVESQLENAFDESPRYLALAVRPVHEKFKIVLAKTTPASNSVSISAKLENPDDVIGYGVKIAKTANKVYSLFPQARNVDGKDVDNPVFLLNNLEAETEYCFQLFAFSAKKDTVYTEEYTFTTEQAIKFKDDYVDLGTGILWAMWNVGAEDATQLGEYYAWGEFEPKDTYSAKTYNLCFDYPITGSSNSNKMTLPIDVTKRQKGNVDGYMISSDEKYLDISRTKYDVAKSKWGGKWRMPTKEEWKKLSQYCNWEQVTIPGTTIKGFKVSNKLDSTKFIYLPAGGKKQNSSTVYKNQTAYYWSSTLWTYTEAIYYGQNVFNMKCDSSDINGRNFADYTDRFYGCLVRPVMDK